ncbi:hypothetical protein ACO2Q0_03110 [Phenylobacterium sp. VNQ135]|uniref:hypothetical protein n=1 Tax=Phenylobacterium sp. VNQ135 TaxID=3400922 RepID=UPI003C035AC2
MRILNVVRAVATAGARLMLAAHLTVLLLLTPLGTEGVVTSLALATPVILTLSPLALAAGIAWRRELPFFRAGYVVVALYGPVSLLVLGLFDVAEPGDVGFLTILYEVGMLAVSIAYVGLWRLGDWLIGRLGARQRWGRLAFLFMFIVSAALWTPQVLDAGRRDSCADRGGQSLPRGGCRYSQENPPEPS